MHPGCPIEQVYLCREPIDFRKSINGLSVLVEQALELNPFGSALTVFINRQRTQIKVPYWHRNGFCLWMKRLEAEKFAWPRDGESATQMIGPHELEWLLDGFDLRDNKPHKTLDYTSVSEGFLLECDMHSATRKPSVSPDRFNLPEVNLPEVLPTDVAALTALLYALHGAHTEVKHQALSHIQHLPEQFILARHRHFGVSPEHIPSQGRLFDEAEILAAVSTDAQDLAPMPPEPAVSAAGKNTPVVKARGERVPLPTGLPRVEIVHDVAEVLRTCPCGTPRVVIGQEVSEQRDIVPMQIRVLRHIRTTYGCPASLHAPVTAPLPPPPLPKSNASPDFLAMLLTVKFIDGLPLARFEYVLDRHGIKVHARRWRAG